MNGLKSKFEIKEEYRKEGLFSIFREIPFKYENLEIIEFSKKNCYSVDNEYMCLYLRRSSIININTSYALPVKYNSLIIDYSYSEKDLFFTRLDNNTYVLSAYHFQVFDNYNNYWECSFKKGFAKVKDYLKKGIK